MRIEEIIWLDAVVEKLAVKHIVSPREVEEALRSRPKIRFAQKGDREGEDLYLALGQANTGRYLAVLFIHKPYARALIISARDMAEKERKDYARK